jgi:NDP-sugar pyrophosphorylase family protein
MDVRAIVLVPGSDTAIPGSDTEGTVGGVPMAYLDVLGLPIVERVLLRLQHSGVSCATLIGRFRTAGRPFTRFRSSGGPQLQQVESRGEDLWRLAEDVFQQYLQAGADLVLIARVGAYVELDYEALIQHHIDKHCSVTAVVDREEERLDHFVLNAAAGMDAATLLGSRMTRLRKQETPFRVAGYVNRLRNAFDLRRLAVDGLLQKNSIQPQGTEVKPGVWVHPLAKIHSKARIVAPAFIGACARIRASAVITRASVVEHHAEVDCGTVIEDSTVLPYTCLGAGLEVVHSVSGLHRLNDLPRHTEVRIQDRKILGMKPLGPIFRLAGIAADFFAFQCRDISVEGSLLSHHANTTEVPESRKAAVAAAETPIMKARECRPESS